MFAKDRRLRQRRRLLIVVVLVALLAGVAYVAVQASDGDSFAGGSSGEGAGSQEAPSRSGEEANAQKAPAKAPDKPAPEETLPDPEQPTPEAAAYAVLAPELPGTTPESIKGVYVSKIDKSWASVRFEPEDEGKPFVVFTHRDGESWKAEKSVRADEPDYAKNDVVPLSGVPEDLAQYLYAENVFAAKVPEPTVQKVDSESLPDVDGATFPPAEPVMDGVPDSERERVENVLGEARQQIEDYHGVTGLYVWDLEGDYGYGIRPDEEFFTASIIKVPVMVAVYRKVDEGELDFAQEIEIKEEDWAAGAGWLQWEKAGTRQTVGDLLLLMMTQSDNVATNALIRTVGGPEHVNEVARSMGAEDTLVYQKVSSERGAVPAIDNRSTPRDMVCHDAADSPGQSREREELRVHDRPDARERARLVAGCRPATGRGRGQQSRLALQGLRRGRARRGRRPPLRHRHPDQARLGRRVRGTGPDRGPLEDRLGISNAGRFGRSQERFLSR